MNTRISKDPKKIKVKMIRVKADGKVKWEILFPLDSVFSGVGISSKREKILQIINDATNSIGRLVAKDHPSRSKVTELHQAGKIISDARQTIVSTYGVEISNFLDVFAKLIRVDRRVINYILQLYSSLRIEDIDDKIPWTVYRYCISTIDKEKSAEVLKLYKEGILKSSNEVRSYVTDLNKNIKKMQNENGQANQGR
ncbi:MAG: hypothetical protein QXV17_08960 [Candidatus Micrarchaeaceae archaeon]